MSAGLVEATVRPGGDGIYCRLFMERERLEAPVNEIPLPLALAWKETRNSSALSQKRRGWHRPGLTHSRRPASILSGEGGLWAGTKIRASQPHLIEFPEELYKFRCRTLPRTSTRIPF